MQSGPRVRPPGGPRPSHYQSGGLLSNAPVPQHGNYNAPRFAGQPAASGAQQGAPSEATSQSQPSDGEYTRGFDYRMDLDAKRLRKSIYRKTVDYFTPVVKYLEQRSVYVNPVDIPKLVGDPLYYSEMLPSVAYPHNMSNAITTKFIRQATNKLKCPVFSILWTPEGRRLVTGSSSGEFTLWNGLTFNFETILQAHDSAVRSMIWSKSDQWLVSGDASGHIRYWQANMNNVKSFQAHRDSIRGISFCPTDFKFATGSDDGTIRIWDFETCETLKVLRGGHGGEVKCVDWHPKKSLLVTGSRDNQQPVKLWDPRTAEAIGTLYLHKGPVTDLKWNPIQSNYLLSSSRDSLVKLFDLRTLKDFQTCKGHKKDVMSVAWHPIYQMLFCSGGMDGSLLFWNVGTEKEVSMVENAHDSSIWSMSWHPQGHILCTGSNDCSVKFWTRNRPGDAMKDKYNARARAEMAVPQEMRKSELEYDDDEDEVAVAEATPTDVEMQDGPAFARQGGPPPDHIAPSFHSQPPPNQPFNNPPPFGYRSGPEPPPRFGPRGGPQFGGDQRFAPSFHQRDNQRNWEPRGNRPPFQDYRNERNDRGDQWRSEGRDERFGGPPDNDRDWPGDDHMGRAGPSDDHQHGSDKPRGGLLPPPTDGQFERNYQDDYRQNKRPWDQRGFDQQQQGQYGGYDRRREGNDRNQRDYDDRSSFRGGRGGRGRGNWRGGRN